MWFLIWGAAILFALLSMYAAACQLSIPAHRSPCLLMIAGGFVLLCAVAASKDGYWLDWIIALAGCAAICVAAFWNGKRDGVIRYKHHLIRLAVCALLVEGFYFY